MDECEVCQAGYPIVTVTFAPDDSAADVNVAMCRDCQAAILDVMVERWNASVEEANRSVAWLMDQLGIRPETSAELAADLAQSPDQ